MSKIIRSDIFMWKFSICLFLFLFLFSHNVRYPNTLAHTHISIGPTPMIAVIVICNIIRNIDGHTIPGLSHCHLDGSFNFSCGISFISDPIQLWWIRGQETWSKKATKNCVPIPGYQMEFESREITKWNCNTRKASAPNIQWYF